MRALLTLPLLLLMACSGNDFLEAADLATFNPQRIDATLSLGSSAEDLHITVEAGEFWRCRWPIGAEVRLDREVLEMVSSGSGPGNGCPGSVFGVEQPPVSATSTVALADESLRLETGFTGLLLPRALRAQAAVGGVEVWWEGPSEEVELSLHPKFAGDEDADFPSGRLHPDERLFLPYPGNLPTHYEFSARVHDIPCVTDLPFCTASFEIVWSEVQVEPAP